MDHRYCFTETFLPIIAFLDTPRVRAIGSYGKKGRGNVRPIAASLTYRKYMVYDKFVISLNIQD